MERLTKRLEDGQAAYHECNGTCGTCDGASCGCVGPMVDRLAAYEDTGLDPEDFHKALSDEILLKAAAYVLNTTPDHIRDLIQAEQEGRLVVLPCKVGDTVWYITPSTEICEAEVIGIWLNVYTNPQMWLEIKYRSKFAGECEHKSRIDLMLGKILFLTREEAEAALAGKGEKNE